MGKLTLLLVGAAILGGSLLTFSTRQVMGESEAGLREQQADLLSRQIAESGHAVVLASIVGNAGFAAPSDRTESYEGGSYRVEYSPASTPARATFEVAGDYAGATHTIKSTYDWDPMSYPGPVWLDVPYATASATSGAKIAGGGVKFDRRKHDELALESLAKLSPMEAGLNTAVSTAGGTYTTGIAAGSWTGMLEDLNVEDGEGLYQAALTQTPETTLVGPLSIGNSRTGIGAVNEVTHVTGDLRIGDKGRLEGSGALLIDGSLEVVEGGRLEWTGIVIVRDEKQFLPVMLNGKVKIIGGLVIVQHAYPPGGHMDVTTWRDLSAGISSSNTRGTGTTSPWNSTAFPWLQHKHRFDEDLGTRRVAYLQGGNAVAAQEAWTQFDDTIDKLGGKNIYLEFANTGRHGYGVYTLDVKGMPKPLKGAVRDGFGTYSAGTSGARFRTTSFAANDLNDFAVDVRSLRTLQDRFDGNGGCDEWPFCIGEQRGRGGALRVQIKESGSNKLLYESALYWHMKSADWAAYQAQEAAWRSQIESGGLFGTRLEMGDEVDIEFKMDPVLDLVERLGFDGNEVIHVGTETEHSTPAENLGYATRADGTTEVCHRPNGGMGTTLAVDAENIREHFGHGDRILACDGEHADAAAVPFPPLAQVAPDCASSPAMVTICNKPGGLNPSTWYDRPMECAMVQEHLNHGCKLGRCSTNGLEPPACPPGQSPVWTSGAYVCG